MLQRTTRHLPGVVQCGVWGNVLVALVQDCDVENVLRSAQAISGASAEYGVGLACRGSAGAHQSCIDAERALRMARVQKLPAARFVDWWLEASLLDFRVSSPCSLTQSTRLRQSTRILPRLCWCSRTVDFPGSGRAETSGAPQFGGLPTDPLAAVERRGSPHLRRAGPLSDRVPTHVPGLTSIPVVQDKPSFVDRRPLPTTRHWLRTARTT